MTFSQASCNLLLSKGERSKGKAWIPCDDVVNVICVLKWSFDWYQKTWWLPHYILVLISTIQYRFYQLCFDSNILVPVFVDMLLVSIHACSKPSEAPIHFLNIHIWKIHPIDHYISTAIVLFSDEKIEHIFLHILLKRKLTVYIWLFMFMNDYDFMSSLE